MVDGEGGVEKRVDRQSLEDIYCESLSEFG